MMRTTVAVPTALLALALAATSAASGGGPAAGMPADGRGVTAPGLAWRIVTVETSSGKPGVVIMRIDRSTGVVERYRVLARRRVVASVAGDATGAGLSADGRTLVLAAPVRSWPVRRSRFEVVDPLTFSSRDRFALRGHFGVDAVSPDGRVLYLIEYLSWRDPTRYRVRAYDLARGRLRRGAIVDPEESGEEMRGMPLSRSVSPDGRWAYTLYDGNGHHPFIHALDTARARAVCIDLDTLTGRDDLWTMRLATRDSGEVVVSGDDGPLLVVDPATFAVRDAARPAVRRRRAPEPSDGVPLALLLAGGVVLAAGAGTAAHRLRSG